MVTVLFDATRLFMRASWTSPTGIDRVTEAYGRWLLSCRNVDLIPVCSWGGVASPMALGLFKRILLRRRSSSGFADRDWRRLVAALGVPAAAAGGLRATARIDPSTMAAVRYPRAALRLLGAWRPTGFGARAVYLNVSHFGLEQPGLLARLAARGVLSVVMIHDLIPIVHPEFCSPSAAGWHRRRIEAVLDHAVLVIANSRTTASDLKVFADAEGRRTPPMCVAPLGLEPVFLSPPGQPLNTRAYFICVGTIEPRKNVTFLLTLWRRLAERMGEATPSLVLAGRRGWETEATIDHLERSPPVRRFVHEIGGLDDDQLARLIGGATALLAPSFSEGFNLPVAEANALGTPVIASDIPVHRELAGGAHLIDPVDGPAWLAAIQAAVVRRPVSSRCEPLGWPGHFAIVAEALERAGLCFDDELRVRQDTPG